MTLQVVFRQAARRDFDDAANWYEERRAGLGQEFITEIDRAITLAAADPSHFPVMHRDVRCVRARRFPYSVFFRVKGNQFVVLAVFHARRDPAVWLGRA